MPLTRGQIAAQQAQAQAQPQLFSQPAIPAPDANFNFDFLMTADKNAVLSALNNFQNLGDYQHDIRQLGAESANGFIRKIKYQAGYDVVLKSSQQDDTDSLAYEYLVGQCINFFSQYFPGFSYTYAACQYKNDTQWQRMKDGPKMEPLSNFIDLLDTRSIENLIGNGCINNKRTCLLTQFVPMVGACIDDVETFAPVMDPTFEQKVAPLNKKQLVEQCKAIGMNVSPKATKGDLIKKLTSHYNKFVYPPSHIGKLDVYTLIFHMTYVMLSSLKNYLTHYDLHNKNVSIVPVPGGRALTVHYYSGGNLIMRYKTALLPVIIDYGRCFVNCAAMQSFEVLKRVCSMDTPRGGPCADSCGNERGYSFSSPYNQATNSFDETDEYSFYINYTKKNNSHDVRFLSDFYASIDFSHVASHPLVELFRRIVPSRTEFGFPEMASAGDGYIRNVDDALQQLTALVQRPGFQTGFEGLPEYGQLHIHADLREPFTFVKTP